MLLGPVRGIAFHPSQDIFVSGGDDRKIKVWSIKTRRCLFTLTGHVDYIRTVVFHHEYPWIMSASDDQTIRIWNWQSRSCISVLTGHNHYVMCARFHPTEDLVASACLDLTIRVWDISELRKKNYSYTPRNPEEEALRSLAPSADVFGNTDVSVKFVLEGHTKGINWVDFHPTLPLLISGGDDRQVKIWRMNDNKAWEVDTCRGHYNNVSCALFHPRHELMLSNSEDKTIRVWDMSKRTLIQTFRRESDRFWVLAAHPELNLFAAGHDSGLVIFKLDRERPAMALSPSQNVLLYVRQNHVRIQDFASKGDNPLITIRRQGGAYSQLPRTLSFNPVDNTTLLTFQSDSGGSFELYRNSSHSEEVGTAIKGTGNAALFTGRNRFAVLSVENQQLEIKDLDSKPVKQIKLTNNVTDILPAPGGNLLLVSPNQVTLFDVQQRKDIATISVNNVKYAIWSPDGNSVALLSKHLVTLANKNLTMLSQIHETIRVKGGAWDPVGVFLFTTLNHIKYVFPQGDSGIICTLDQPIYLTRIQGNKVHYLDRDAQPQTLPIDTTEYKFKLALINHEYDKVLHTIKNSNLVGQSIIAYLRKKGYSEIALHFIKDERTRFELSLECGNIEAALSSAKELNDDGCWIKLAAHALDHGNVQVVEVCHQRVKNLDKLTFLYFVTGDLEKVKKMQKVADMRGDYGSLYQTSLLIDDATEQIKVLKASGKFVLAYLTAKNHGLDEEAQSIAESCEISPEVLAKLPTTSGPLKPSQPISSQPHGNWPLLNVSKSVFDRFFATYEANNAKNTQFDDDEDGEDATGAWGDEDDNNFVDAPTGSGTFYTEDNLYGAEGDEEDGGWGMDPELQIDEDIGRELVSGLQSTGFTMPSSEANPLEIWARNSPLPADHITAGSFETAMQLLNRQIGVVNFAPLKPLFLSLYQSSQSYLVANSSLPSQAFAIRRNPEETNRSQIRPINVHDFQSLLAKLKEGYRLFNANKPIEATEVFTNLLHSIPLLVVESRSDAEEAQQMIQICREYILGLNIDRTRRETPTSDPEGLKRALELAAYFTHCQLDPKHSIITINLAMTLNFKNKNFVTASLFSRRLLELGPNPKLSTQAKQIQQVSERTPRDEVSINYDQYNPFVVCAKSLVPIYQGSPSVQCGYCKASYLPEYKDQLCTICELSQIGLNGTGLKLN